jgi:polysaccharide deacetylase 2 family uncharacterized protein YibQ
MKRKLFFAWIIFLITVVLFLLGVEFYHNFQNEHLSSYQYRILIDKNLVVEEEEKVPDQVPVKEEHVKEEHIFNPDTEFYEKTKYGYLPRVSQKGAKVFDEYSACSEISAQKELRVIIIVEDASQIDQISKLGNQKVSFVVPYYIDKLEEVIEAIRKKGHEFFLQIPTQFSIPADKKATISPFLANADQEDTLDKLFYLLGSAKYAIGIANVSPTLFTKSKRDMNIIANALIKRGIAFLDIEKSGGLLKDIAENSDLIYIHATNMYESNTFDLSKIKDREILVVQLDHLDSFLKSINSDWLLAPVSASVRK